MRIHLLLREGCWEGYPVWCDFAVMAHATHSPQFLCDLLGIRHPIIQAGMVWCTGADLVVAVGRAGGLGTLGAGSMYPDELREEIAKVKAAWDGPFAVNIPLLYPDVEAHMETVIRERVPVVFTSAGSPRKWTDHLKSAGATVIHVVSSAAFALKAQAAGVDAVVAEGFEAGGHNGREETTTMCLVPEVVDAVDIPVIAAGGLHDARTLLAALALGASGVQMGSRFVMTRENPAHQRFKQRIVAASPAASGISRGRASAPRPRTARAKFGQRKECCDLRSPRCRTQSTPARGVRIRSRCCSRRMIRFIKSTSRLDKGKLALRRTKGLSCSLTGAQSTT